MWAAGTTPSAKVIDLFRCAFHAGKGCSDGHPQGAGKPSLFPSPSTASRNGKSPCRSQRSPSPNGAALQKPKSYAHRAGGQERGKSREKPRRGRPPKAEKAAPEQGKPPKAGKTHAAPRKRQHHRPRKCRLRPVTPPAPKKEEIVYLDLSDLLKDHPFGVRDDAEMKSLVESVRERRCQSARAGASP